MKTEQTAHGTRIYLSPERIATLKIGETFSVDRFNDPPTHTCAYDGRRQDGYHRWVRESDGRVFVYTDDQCCRLIYYLRPKA